MNLGRVPWEELLLVAAIVGLLLVLDCLYARAAFVLQTR